MTLDAGYWSEDNANACADQAPAVRKVVARAFDHAGAQGDDQCGDTARLSKLTSGSG
jgi:hypothetical protein